MKRFFWFILVALLGLILSIGIPSLLGVKAQQPNQTQDYALTLVQAGKKYYDGGQFSAAAQTLQQAAQIYQAAGDELKQAQTLSLLSLAYEQLGRWQEAEVAIDSSLSLLKTLPMDDERIHAQVLNRQGRWQLTVGKAQAALETFQDAEVFYAQAGDTVGVMGSQINQAQALQALGLYRRSQKLFTQIEQQLQTQPDSALKAVGLHNLGNLLRQGGDLERSREILELSLAVAQSPKDESKILLSLGNTERALAKRVQELNNEQQAEHYRQKALNYYQTAAAIANLPILQIQAQLNQLSLLIETEKFVSAQALLPQISELLNQLPASRASVYARVNLAQSLIEMGNREWQSSVINNQNIPQILNAAIEQTQSLADQRAESYAFGTLGEFYEKTEDWSKAKNFTQSALLIAQTIKAPDLAYQWQWQMGRILQAQTEKTLLNQDANPEAIAYYTQAFKILNSLRSDLVILNPEVQFSFREKVEPVYRQLVDLLLRSTKPSKDNLIQARNVIEALQLAELDNFFRDACAKPEEVNIDDLDPSAAVIYPIILPNRLEVILKLPGTDNLRHYVNHDVSAAQVDEAVQKLRKSLKRRSTSLSQIKTESKQIYDWLIKPWEIELETAIQPEQSQIKTLVFVLDGSLRNVPMAALYGGQRYLIERYAVAVTPGLQLLEPKPLRREPLSALIAGATNAPSFQAEGLGILDNVAVELWGIENQVSTEKLENQDFHQEKLKSQINSAPFNVVHLATHGKFSSNPEQTFILDWEKRIKVKDLDGLLQVGNQRDVKPIELLILSACETATGDKRAALGLAGVAIRAGARSTLATLWNINDASTAQFMIQFYQQLNNPQINKAQALRNAQLTFLSNYPDTDYNRPYHWAPFILVGNWL